MVKLFTQGGRSYLRSTRPLMSGSVVSVTLPDGSVRDEKVGIPSVGVDPNGAPFYFATIAKRKS